MDKSGTPVIYQHIGMEPSLRISSLYRSHVKSLIVELDRYALKIGLLRLNLIVFNASAFSLELILWDEKD